MKQHVASSESKIERKERKKTQNGENAEMKWNKSSEFNEEKTPNVV